MHTLLLCNLYTRACFQKVHLVAVLRDLKSNKTSLHIPTQNKFDEGGSEFLLNGYLKNVRIILHFFSS